jgi:dipeptidyl aminopeptidase/acylaminoacyl peptidase
MIITHRWALAAALSLALAAPAVSAPRGTMNEEIRQVRDVRTLALSPSGAEVAAVISDSTADGGKTHIWLLPASGAEGRQLTRSPADKDGGEDSPAWSPDGRWLYFLASRAESRRLMRLPLDGGEAQPFRLARKDDKPNGAKMSGGWAGKVEGEELSVRGFAPSPDGRWLAITAEDADDPKVAENKGKKDDARRIGFDHKKVRLYLVEVASGAAREVALPLDAGSPLWTADSKRLTIVVDPESDDLGPASEAWVVPIEGKPTRLPAPPATVITARLAGEAVVYLAQCQDDTPPGCSDLYVIDKPGAAPRNLTRGLKGSLVGDFTVRRDNTAAVMLIDVGVQQRIGAIPLAGGEIAWMDTGLPVTAGLSTNLGQSGWTFVAGSSVQPATPYVVRALGDKPVRLSTPALVPAGWKPVQSRLISWQSDGLTIEGLLYLPPGLKGKVPLVVNVHGGPAGTFLDSNSNLVNLLVSQGWAVLQPNPRGGTAYGTAFLAANKNDMGGGDYRDIMAGVDKVIADYPIDDKRMALIGYSYGGEMAGFVAGRTDRFKALVSGAPVIDQFSEYGTEDSSWYDRWYYGLPWRNFADAWRQSPLSTAHKARTPFLLLQGEDDTTDPPGQSWEMYRALRQEGVPVELILYPRSNHGVLGAAFAGRVSREPWHGVDLRRRMITFIQGAFDGEKVPKAE